MLKRACSVKTLVLGLGNLLLADEGFGVHAARALIHEDFADKAIVLDIGTAVLDALPSLEEADYVIILDAVTAGGEPGTIYRLPYNEMEKPRCIASMHGFDLSRVLALTGRRKPPEVTVIGVEPANIQWSLELSPEVARILPNVIEAVKKEIMTREKIQ